MFTTSHRNQKCYPHREPLRHSTLDSDTVNRAATRLWCLRALVSLSGYPSAKTKTIAPAILEYVELSLPKEKSAAPASVQPLAERALSQLETRPQPRLGPVSTNCDRVARELGLNDTERDVTEFAMYLVEEPMLARITELFGELSTSQLVSILAQVLGHGQTAIRHAIAPGGLLYTCNLAWVDQRSRYPMAEKLETSALLAQTFAEPHDNLFDLFRRLFAVSPPAELARKDFLHHSTDWQIVAKMLCVKPPRPAPAPNILLWGQPGTGKTQFARAVAESAGVDLVEMNTENLLHDPLRKGERLSHYRLAQALLERRDRTAILIDEAEDLFPTRLDEVFGTSRQAAPYNAHFLKLLEEAKVPAIWICNQVSHIDGAAFRRFGFIQKFDSPPPNIRKRIIRRLTRGIPLTKELIDELSHDPSVTPAIVEQAACTCAIAASRAITAESIFKESLNNTLTALRKKPISGRCRSQHERYNLAFTNADCDLKALTTGLAHRRSGRLCLYGPPGTGKSGYGAFIARKLRQPLVELRGSDLLAPHVGETEQRIAEHFRRAQRRGAILIIDEVDGFLQERTYALRTWELTQINEMLTQIENYAGILICTTNLMDTLDQAILRRFDIKMRFGYLKPPQAWALFRSTLKAAAVQPPGGAEARRAKTALKRCQALAPGDYAAAVRRIKLLCPNPTWKSLLTAIIEEHSIKPAGRARPMGFINTP